MTARQGGCAGVEWLHGHLEGGGTKLLRLQENGCAGVLTDGRLRDFDELARYEFAAYCSGEATMVLPGKTPALAGAS